MQKHVDQQEAENILELGSIATKVTEMGVSDFWGNLVILIATEKGYGNGPQKVAFKRNADSLLVAIGDFTETDGFEVKAFKALDCEMSYTTFNDGVVFDIPIKNEVQDNSEQVRVPIEQIVSQLKELGIYSHWIKRFTDYASFNGFKESLPEPRLTATKNKVYITFGDPDTAASAGFSKLKLEAQKPGLEWAINKRGGVFHFPRAEANGIKDDAPAVQNFFDNLSNPQSTQPEKETSVTEENKDQCEATKHGPTLTVEEITGILIDLGVSENDVKESFFHLPTKLAIGKLPNVTIHRVDDKITLTYGNTEKATLLDKAAAQDARLPDSMRLSPEEIRYEAFDDVVNQSGLYIYTVPPKKETEMAYLPKTTIQILKPIYRDRLQKAGLSDEAVQFISDEVFHGSALKAPKEDSSFVVVAGKDVLNVYYSFDNSSVVLTNAEANQVTRCGEVISYGTGINDAFFAIDTSNTQDKLIQKHVGTPKLKLCFSDGFELDIPYMKRDGEVTKEGVSLEILCNVLIGLKDKRLHDTKGPALRNYLDLETPRYFLSGVEHTEEQLRKRTVPGAGSWADIE